MTYYSALYYQEMKRFSLNHLLALNCAMAKKVVGCKLGCWFYGVFIQYLDLLRFKFKVQVHTRNLLNFLKQQSFCLILLFFPVLFHFAFLFCFVQNT